MTLAAVLVAAGSALGSSLLIRLLLPVLLRHVLARPNERSSHRRPTPQGGGIAVVAAALGGGGIGLAATGLADGRAAWLAAAFLGLAATGLADDVRPLSTGLRLAIQAACAAILVCIVLPERVLPLPGPAALGAVLLGIALVWWINLTNFMDGIDWMTVAEFGPMTAALCGMSLLGFGSPAVAVVAAALGGGLAGFAPFNRPVARLFLGDVGSLPVGLATGWMLADLAAHGALAAALLLPMYYAADATLTLCRRALARERVWEAHRSHFYQRALDHGFRAIDVVARVAGLNACLIALAALTLAWPEPAVAGLALGAGAVLVGSTLRLFAAPRP